MTTYYVGDIHGKLDILQRVAQLADRATVVLVGDLVDDFTAPIMDQLACVSMALALYRPRFIYLMGNHELSYCAPPQLRASGYTAAMAAHLMPLRTQLSALPAYWLSPNGVLATHAGLTQPVDTQLEEQWPSHSLVGRLQASITDSGWTSPLYAIGRRRGGFSPDGGIFWSDVRDFVPIPGIRQVFGHTKMPLPTEIVPGNWNIDCLDSTPMILKEDDDGKLSPITVEDAVAAL